MMQYKDKLSKEKLIEFLNSLLDEKFPTTSNFHKE